ncbi:hypothetical protein SSX86_031971, partial [Deinandra increscens subsp. villosa]
MFKFAILLILSLFFHSSSVLCQKSLHVLTLHHADSSYNNAPVETMGVAVDEEKLHEVSTSILMAENWLRTHVLYYYPSSGINSIIVANELLCNGGNIRNRDEIVRLTVDSMKNLHHSLTRWGLEREIKVSVSFSSNCLHESHLKPVFGLLEKINSTYTINLTRFSDETVDLLTSELKSMNDLGVFRSETVNVILPTLKQAKSTSRKLSFIDNLWSAATPPPPPPPVVQFSPAPASLSYPPEIQPPASSPSHPYGFSLPPCNPNPYPQRYHAAPPAASTGSPAAAPVIGNGEGPVAAPPAWGGEEQLWCVAKPSVP